MNELLDVLFEFRFGIVGATLIAVLAAHLAWRNNKKVRFAAANQRFRSSVYVCLQGLYPAPIDWPRDTILILNVLESKLPTLQAAVSEFGADLPWWRRALFNRAWRLYRVGNRKAGDEEQDYWQYVPHRETTKTGAGEVTRDNTGTYKAAFKRNIDRLLSYAKET